MFGLLVVLAGVVGAVVLFVASQRRPEQAVDEFARAPVGCTTTLEFTDTGTFFVFEERSDAPAPPLGECQPVADPDQVFGFVLRDDSGPIDGELDNEVGYEFGARSGQSVAAFDIAEPGRYEIEVVGDDLTVVAAIGRDPDESVGDLQRAAIAVGAGGLLLGGLLLFVSGRRSRRAAAPGSPAAAIPWERPDDSGELPEPPRAYVPPSVDTPPPTPSPWAPPTGGPASGEAPPPPG